MRTATESQVRLYSRNFPAVFVRAKGTVLEAENGKQYLDFLCGAGALNYGHNHDHLKERILAHLAGDGLVHGLDMDTAVKREFLARFGQSILHPRGLDHRVQFCGPTGANAVEAALRLARKVTGRQTVIAFMGAFHGMSAGALAVSGRPTPLRDTVFVPYETGPAGRFDSVSYLADMLADESSGMSEPAAVIVETTQMDGGVLPASPEWLRGVADVAARHGALLICDEIQTGCGRTGDFFGFERAGIVPDLITLSKSLSGYGLPLSVLLMRPDLDRWAPGEHTGTFRANQLALVGATAALDLWQDKDFHLTKDRAATQLREFGVAATELDPRIAVRCQGLTAGLDMTRAGGHERALAVQRRCFARGLVVELSGRRDEVVKVMPPLTVGADELDEGLAVLWKSIAEETA
jgi:diaminobutyrate-2-oxoglutarate transaminase